MYILVCALLCCAIVLDECCSCKLLSDACTHHSSLLLLTCQGKGAGTEPLQIVPDLTNTSSFFTHVCKHPTDGGSINKRFVTCCYPRIVWVLPQVPCSFALWYNSYIPACLIAPRLSCVHALMCPRCSYDRESVYSLSWAANNRYCRLRRGFLTCSKLCQVTLLDKCPQ